jgi:hypothetical protein
VPPDITAEADGPAGATLTYAVSTPFDLGEPVPVSCSPSPGSVFPLGRTGVTCTASDPFGNRGTASFTATVVDTTKPTLNVPAPITVSSNGASSLASSAKDVAAFLAAANARDLVDGPVPVTSNAPASLPVGTTTLTFTAKDRAGNAASAHSQITVVTTPVAPVVIDAAPPGDVTGLKAVAGDGSVSLSWKAPGDSDFDHVTVTRSLGSSGQALVYQGAQAGYSDTGLKNGLEYRYVVIAFDKAGNGSRGLVIRATPKAQLLTTPRDGAVVTKPPVLKWRALSGATYYNVQLYRVSGAKVTASAGSTGTKILSAWPDQPRLAMQKSWKFNRKLQQLLPGRYLWYVWPGLGARTAQKYGAVMGESSFVVKAVAKKKATVKKKKAPARPKAKGRSQPRA